MLLSTGETCCASLWFGLSGVIELEQAKERHVQAARMRRRFSGDREPSAGGARGEGRVAAARGAAREDRFGGTSRTDRRRKRTMTEGSAVPRAGRCKQTLPSGMCERRHWLSVPYAEREQAKAAGARWSEEARCWYAPADADLSPLSAWLPQQTQTQRDPRQEFAEALRDAGLVLDGEPIMDGQFHRVPVEGAKRGARDGAYVGHIGGSDAGDRAHGYCKNHKTGEERRWSALGTVPLSRQQRAEIEQQKKETWPRAGPAACQTSGRAQGALARVCRTPSTTTPTWRRRGWCLTA